jgi:hypothetical protein
MVEGFISAIGMWFGFVGSCVAGSGTACRPFLAFVAITAAAGVALVLLVLAFRALQQEYLKENSTDRLAMHQHARPSVATVIARTEPVRGWRVAA